MRGSTVLKFHQNNGRAVETGAPSVEKDFASIKAANEDPPSSFEFYVWSDVGINLHVDLNLPPSDWINRFRNEACISENVHGNKSRSFWQDLGGLGEYSMQGKSSFLRSTNSGQIDDHDGQGKSSSSLKLTKDGATELDQQNKDDSPLIRDSLNPYSMTINVEDNLQENHSTLSAELNVHVVDNLMRDQSSVSAEVSYGALNNFVSGAESYAIDVSKKIIYSDDTSVPFIKSLCDSANSLSEPGTLELQDSKPDNECSEDGALQNGSRFVNPGVVCAGAPLCSSVGPQSSEVISCHKHASVLLCDNDGSLDLSDPKSPFDIEQGRLVKTWIHFETDSNNFTSLADEREVGKIVDGRQSSECSRFDDPLKKSSIDYNNQDFKMELRRKREGRDSVIQSSNGKPTTTRVLRSMKINAPRRSMRLISK